MNIKKINLKIFILPLINIFFFITISSFGQTFLMDIGLSFISSLFLMIIFVYNIKKIPLKILLIYILLIVYTAILSIGKDNWNFWTISIFTLSASFSTLKFDLKDNEWKISFLLMAMFSNIVLLMYDWGIFLTNWNPNTIAMFTLIGIMGYIIAFYVEKKVKNKILIFTLIAFSSYMLYITDSRNSLLMYLIAFITVLFAKRIFNSKILLKIYAIFSMTANCIIATLANTINDLPVIKNVLSFSKEAFGKSTLFSNREIFWEKCKFYIGDNWILGTGDSLYKYTYAHNMFYSVAYSYGIVGYIIYIIFIYQIVKFIYKYARKDIIATASTLIFLAIMYGQITENLLFTSDTNVFLVYIFLSIGLGRAIRKKEKSKDEKDNNIYTNI